MREFGKKIMKPIFYLLLGIGMILIVSCGSRTERVEFDITKPTDSWYRFDDPDYNISIWLPDDWEGDVWDVPDSDVSEPTHYHPTGEDNVTELWINIIPPTDFTENYCDPVISNYNNKSKNDCDDPPMQVYEIQNNHLSMPCARYDIGSHRWKHICVTGPYSAKLFHPESIEGQRFIQFTLYTNADWEAQVVPLFKKIVVSFVLEQPPDKE
jgi:hypothetical protein